MKSPRLVTVSRFLMCGGIVLTACFGNARDSQNSSTRTGTAPQVSQAGLPAEASPSVVLAGTSATPIADLTAAVGVEQLLSSKPAAGARVQLVATVASIHSCPPCDPEVQCKPCSEWLLLAPSGQGAAPEESLALWNYPAGFIKGQVYAFEVLWRNAPSQEVSINVEGAAPRPAAADVDYLRHSAAR